MYLLFIYLFTNLFLLAIVLFIFIKLLSNLSYMYTYIYVILLANVSLLAHQSRGAKLAGSNLSSTIGLTHSSEAT